MNSISNKLIIIAGVILVILIAVTVYVNSLTKSNQTGRQPTLIPTGIFEQSGSGGSGSNPISQSDKSTGGSTSSHSKIESIKEALQNNSSASETDVNRLNNLKENLPVDNTDFTFAYSPSLDRFFVVTKTPDGVSKFQQYLVNNSLADLFQKFPTILMTIASGSIDQEIQNVESGLQQQQNQSQQKEQTQTENQQQNSQQSQQNQTKKPINLTKDQQQTIVRDNNMLKSFAEFAGSLFNFNTGSSSNLQDIVNSALTPIPTPTGNAGGGNNGGGGGGNNNYRNPLRAVKGLVSLRVDEGVDYFGSGPVYAIGNGQVAIYMNGNSDWPGGDWISYKLLDGPAKGFYVYVAEDCALNTSLHVGSIVNSNTVLCTMGPYIETGWAVSNADWAISHSYYCVRGPCSQGTNVDGTAMQSGLNFSAFMKYIGGPPGNPAASTNWPHQGIDPLPPGLPSW